MSESLQMKACIDNVAAEDLDNKVVFVRVDFNVPIDKATGTILNDARIRQSIPTINYLQNKGAKIVLCSHLGRPDGKVKHELSLANVAWRLGLLLADHVEFVADCIGESVEKAVAALPKGKVLLLENIRFYAEEEKNDPDFAFKLIKGINATVFVNDGFSAAHRAHASTEGVSSFVDISVAGFSMRDEIVAFEKLLSHPETPVAAIIGGAKLSTKITVLLSLLPKVDKLLIGGAMVFTFYRAMGLDIGESLHEESQIPECHSIMREAKKQGVKIVLAPDVVVAERLLAEAPFQVVGMDEMPDGWIGLDIGPNTLKVFEAELADCKTVLWNGPMGANEIKPFAEGTYRLIDIVASLTDYGVTTIICGGDTVSAVEEKGNINFTHISSGGGASLELLEGKVLPGIRVLDQIGDLKHMGVGVSETKISEEFDNWKKQCVDKV